MPPCTHCEFTRCPKCGHDCAKELSSSQGIVDNSKTYPTNETLERGDAVTIGADGYVRKINSKFWEVVENSPGIAGVLAKPGSGEE